jgi:hypothetical protein
VAAIPADEFHQFNSQVIQGAFAFWTSVIFFHNGIIHSHSIYVNRVFKLFFTVGEHAIKLFLLRGLFFFTRGYLICMVVQMLRAIQKQNQVYLSARPRLRP